MNFDLRAEKPVYPDLAIGQKYTAIRAEDGKEKGRYELVSLAPFVLSDGKKRLPVHAGRFMKDGTSNKGRLRFVRTA